MYVPRRDRVAAGVACRPITNRRFVGGGGGGGGGGAGNGGHCRGQGEDKRGGTHRNGGGGSDENEEPAPKRKTKSKLGKEIDVYLAQARDENTREVFGSGGVTGEATAYSRLVAKAQLEGRKSRWPGPRNNGKSLASVGGAGPAADPFGRPMTTKQRRRIAAIEVAEDGGQKNVNYVEAVFIFFV